MYERCSTTVLFVSYILVLKNTKCQCLKVSFSLPHAIRVDYSSSYLHSYCKYLRKWATVTMGKSLINVVLWCCNFYEYRPASGENYHTIFPSRKPSSHSSISLIFVLFSFESFTVFLLHINQSILRPQTHDRLSVLYGVQPHGERERYSFNSQECQISKLQKSPKCHFVKYKKKNKWYHAKSTAEEV